jgi:hypothetical protein
MHKFKEWKNNWKCCFMTEYPQGRCDNKKAEVGCGGGQTDPATLVFNEKLHIMDKFFRLDGLFHENIRMNPVQILI